ncbi:hypothetical protein G6514_000834 [Epicoccum nigrum]|nr:hypothetical protein G6514_000834 [Epicoccum nigrum]
MDDQPLALLSCRPDYPANPLSYPSQIQDMQLVDFESLYADFRSPSRAARQRLRKRRSPKQHLGEPRTRKLPHRPLRPLSHPVHQYNLNPNRGQCTKKHRDPDLNDEAYWDKLAAEWRVEEQRQMMDPVQLYYNFGHGAAGIESLRPAPYTAEEEETDTEGWADVSLRPSSSSSSASPEAEAEAEGEDTHTVETPLWKLFIPQPSSPLSTEPWNTSYTCTFTYHRNASGLWELGYAAPHYVPNICSPSVLLVACTLSNAGARECSCAEFEDVDGWRAPDEVWRGSLVEWMSEEEGEELEYADARYACDTREDRRADSSQKRDLESAKRGSGGLKSEWALVRRTRSPSACEAEWDVVSEVSSTGSWRVVDAW